MWKYKSEKFNITEVIKKPPATQSVLPKNKFLSNPAQKSLTLRNFPNLIEKLKRHKVSDFHQLKFKNTNKSLKSLFLY